MFPVYCLEHVLHVNKYTTFLEEHFRSGGLIKLVLCVFVDLTLSLLTMCSQISYLDFLHSPQDPYIFEEALDKAHISLAQNNVYANS